MFKKPITDTANFMAAAAKTAPKTRGIDNIEILIITDEKTIKNISSTMEELGKKLNRPSFIRDSANIKDLEAIVIIGVISNPAGLNCGFCGFDSCEGLKKSGGVCAYNSIDLGIAVSSAASVACNFRVDNRIMYSVGKTVMELKLFTKDVKLALGIPLSVSGKNIFFDRS